MNTVVAETAIIVGGASNLAWPVLIYTRRLITPTQPRQRGGNPTTTARAATVAKPAALAGQPAAQSPAQLSSVKPAAATTRNPRLPRLPDAAEMKNPRLAEFARGRERDPVTGHWLPRKQAS